MKFLLGYNFEIVICYLMGRINLWWGGTKNLVGWRSNGGTFPCGGDEQIFGWWRGTLPHPPGRENPVYGGLSVEGEGFKHSAHVDSSVTLLDL